MSKELIISASSLERRIAIVEDDNVTEIFIERSQNRGILGNIYKGRVTKVLPGMQAAFVDIGLDRNAFLYVADFFESYDEYEEIFVETDRSLEDLLRAEGVEPEEPRRPLRGRGRSRRERPRVIAEPGTVGAAPTETAHSVRPLAPRPAGTARHRDPILPEQLGFSRPAGYDASAHPAESIPRSGDILPERLETVVEFHPAVEPETPRGEEPLADREARLEGKPDISYLAVASKETRRKKRREGGKTSAEPLIGDLLKERQEILVQVAKEPIARKGARITSHVVLPGRFLVYMPTVDHVGVSRKIASLKERQRLRTIIEDMRGDFGRGFIVRTAGEGKSQQDLRADMVYLTRLWGSIRQKAEKVSAPSLVHSELDLVQRVVRDYFSDDYRAIRVDDEQEYERIVDFISNFNPDLVSRVRLYNKRTPIFDEFGVTAEIENALKQKVWLKTGGYIVINQTEALVAIDVNTGKYVGNTNSLEDTIVRTNLDAVKEVVRQIRLRDLGGIIVVDFIDMNDVRNRDRVMELLQQELSKDKAPSKILPFNEFGLVAITRKRVKQSLERTLCQPCAYCTGTGMTKSLRTICYTIHQEVRKVLHTFKEGNELIIRCHPDVARALRETERIVLKEIEELVRRTVTIQSDALMHIEQFSLVES